MKNSITKKNIFTYSFEIVSNSKNYKIFLLVFAIALIIYSFLYGVWKIPVVDFGINRMSPITLWDYLFIFTTSLIIATMIILIRHEKISQVKSSLAFSNTPTAIAGVVAAVCPTCQGIAIIALGSTVFNIPFGPLIPYLGIIKLVSFGLLLLVLYLKMDSIYNDTCISCKITKKGK
ncbi:hypothetical protein HYU23_04500 [Candidatus Woesearchaeota archaeon]|nr:hypothetical protein [Candidatus Woesearchaeota archaeon]